jgi:hypothetical protein
VRTVRSAAWSRNRPRRRLAWLIVLILLVLIALAARVDAAPGGDPIDLARRFADAMTGAGRAGRAPALAADDDGDDDDDGDGDGDGDGDDDDGDDEEDDDDREPDDAADDGDRRAELAPDGDGAGDRGAIDDDHDTLADLATGGDRDDGDDEPPGSALTSSGALAMLDAEQDPGDATAGLDLSHAAASAGAQEVYEQWMRHQRPSWLGRLDVGVSWHRRWSAPLHAPARRHDEVWLVATWRR